MTVLGAPETFRQDWIAGLAAAYSRLLYPVPGASGVLRNDVPRHDRVAVLIGGGCGHYPAFAGLVGTWQTLDYQVDAQFVYRAHGRHEGFSPGDEVRFDASLQYRVWPAELGAGTRGFVYAVLESNLEHRRRDVVDGDLDADSGGTQWLVAPGLQYVGRRWIAEAAAQLPVSQSPQGDAIQDPKGSPTAAGLYFPNPFKRARKGDLWATHPPLDERIRRLEG
jgi:hypothetical protein